MELIGNKENFAIEFEIINSSQMMGYARIWLNGSYITTIYDYCYFHYLNNFFDQICSSAAIEPYFKGNSIPKTFFSLRNKLDDEEDSKKSFKYRVGGSSFGDEFLIFSYLESNTINIFWKPYKNARFKDVKELKKKVYHFSMDKEKFSNLSKEYLNYIESYAKKNHISITEKFNADNIEVDNKDRNLFFDFLETKVSLLSEFNQRKVIYQLCLLIENDLEKLGLEALELIEFLTRHKYPILKSEAILKRLRKKMPDEGLSPFSVLIWAFTPQSDSFPVWYSAQIIGINIFDLKIKTYREMYDLLKIYLINFDNS